MMPLIQIPFQPETCLAEMLALAHAGPEANLHVVDLPYRLCAWALDDAENVALWTSPGGELQAWAILQSPFWTIDLACRPRNEEQVLPVILEWAEQRARAILERPYGHPAWFVPVFPSQTVRIGVLEAAGFANQAHVPVDPWSQVFLSRPGLPLPPAPVLPAGFQLRLLAGAREAEAYVALHRLVFESKSMTTAWRQRTLAHPAHRPDLDLVIAAPDGRLAAFCIGWFDPAGYGGVPCGQIEPLGVHPAFRGLGLGKSILNEALRRLAGCGAQQVYVETDNYRNAAFDLYTSAGFYIQKEVHVYRKDIE